MLSLVRLEQPEESHEASIGAERIPSKPADQAMEKSSGPGSTHEATRTGTVMAVSPMPI
jgi:hypothetical protein